MTFSIENILPENFNEAAKVWIYQSERAFNEVEVTAINSYLHQFIAEWKSHGTPVKGWASVLFHHFIIIMADETHTGVSGCSTDSSVHIIKAIESTYKVNMFDRLKIALVKDDAIQLVPMHTLKSLIANDAVNADTLFFDNLVNTKQQLQTKWIKKVGESWLSNKLLQVS